MTWINSPDRQAVLGQLMVPGAAGVRVFFHQQIGLTLSATMTVRSTLVPIELD